MCKPLMFILLISMSVSPQTNVQTDQLKPLRYFLARGKERGRVSPGESKFERGYKFVLNGKFLEAIHRSNYAPQKRLTTMEAPFAHPNRQIVRTAQKISMSGTDADLDGGRHGAGPKIIDHFPRAAGPDLCIGSRRGWDQAAGAPEAWALPTRVAERTVQEVQMPCPFRPLWHINRR